MLALTTFFYGFLAACAGLLIQILLMSFSVNDNFTAPHLSISFIIAAALTEELMKLGFLLQAKRRYDLPALSLSSLLAFGLGFAGLEIGIATLTTDYSAWPEPFLPLFYNTLFHVGTVLLLGLALKKFGIRHPLTWVTFLGVSLVHVMYNLYRDLLAV